MTATAALPPRAIAIPQKESLRAQPHLYESLSKLEQFSQDSAAWMAAIGASLGVSLPASTESTRTVVATAGPAYTAAAGQIVFVDATVAVTVTLPPAPTHGDVIDVKKVAGGQAVTIDGNGSTVDTAATRVISTLYESLELVFDAGFGWGIV